MRIVIPEIIALSKNKACGECSPVNLGELKITIFKMAAVTIILVTMISRNLFPSYYYKFIKFSCSKLIYLVKRPHWSFILDNSIYTQNICNIFRMDNFNMVQLQPLLMNMQYFEQLIAKYH